MSCCKRCEHSHSHPGSMDVHETRSRVSGKVWDAGPDTLAKVAQILGVEVKLRSGICCCCSPDPHRPRCACRDQVRYACQIKEEQEYHKVEKGKHSWFRVVRGPYRSGRGVYACWKIDVDCFAHGTGYQLHRESLNLLDFNVFPHQFCDGRSHSDNYITFLEKSVRPACNDCDLACGCCRFVCSCCRNHCHCDLKHSCHHGHHHCC